MTRIVAFVPAKGLSERIANKNLAIVDGEHLFRRKLLQLVGCPLIHEVFLDTEDEKIAALVRDLPVKRLQRPAELARNSTDGHELFAWECAQVDADIYVQALCTAPFVSADTVTRAISSLLDSPAHDSLVAVGTTKIYGWSDGEPEYGRGRIPNSVNLPNRTFEAMSLYVTRKAPALSGRRFGMKPLLFELDPIELIDVNLLRDLELATAVAAGLRAKENHDLRAILPLLSSALLSDVTRELGHGLALPLDFRATSGARMFGRARTLLIDRVTQDEDWRGIYDALGSYKHVQAGDIIVVENRVPQRAYFGSLNAHLAFRAGAVGALIDGVTRDTAAVETLEFPVFARGAYAVDVREEGVLRSMNEPVRIGDVLVRSGDYIFGDRDGVVAIPSKIWPMVRDAVILRAEREAKVSWAVAQGVDGPAIWKSVGDF
jgi:regulator of RNase E activity RraA/CMP-N-acetylneuraminic acid synthetase